MAALLAARAADPTVAASAQAPGVPGSPDDWVHVTNVVEAAAYEQRYGAPIVMSACTMLDEPVVPPQRSIRTFGRFDPGQPGARRHPEAAPGSTATGPRPLCDTPGQTGPLRMADTGAPCERLVFRICCEDRGQSCLSITPVPELASVMEADAESYRNQRVTVVGAHTGAAFEFWDFQVMADFARRSALAPDSGLRRVVAEAGRGDGRVVRIRGQFRGRNLFGDLPEESRRGRNDWVLADQGAALWVRGKAPKGEGFSLDLDQPSASSRWLEVEGEVEARDGVVYLKASSVTLVSGPLPAPSQR